MAAINFPSSPIGGQQYTFNGITYYYDAGVGAWLTSVVGNPIVIATATTGSTAPSTPVAGDLWFNTDLSKMFVYYNDGDTSQWVEPSYSTVFNRDADLNASFTVANAAFNLANGVANGTSVNVATQVLTDAATISWNTSLGSVATITLTAAGRTMSAPTNLKVGSYLLNVVQDGSGNRTITTWNSVFKWPGGVAPTLTTTANARDIISFVSDGTNLYGSFLPDVK